MAGADRPDGSWPATSARRNPARGARGEDGAPRADDADIAGAAAEIAGKPEPDPPFVRVGQPDHQVARGNQHAGRAVSALQGMLARESGPQLGGDVVLVEALDCRDGASLASDRECQAGAHRLAIEQNGARAAHAVLAA